MISTVAFWLLIDPTGTILDEFEGGEAGLQRCQSVQAEVWDAIPYEDEALTCHGYADGAHIIIQHEETEL